jgi:hypothetical protein
MSQITTAMGTFSQPNHFGGRPKFGFLEVAAEISQAVN